MARTLDARLTLVAAAIASALALVTQQWPLSLAGVILAFVSARVIASDLSQRLVFDVDVIIIFVGGLLVGPSCALASSLADWFSGAADQLTRAAAIGGAIWLVAVVFRLIAGREGLGLGDVKLIAAWAVWMPALASVNAITVAAFIALAIIGWQEWRRREDSWMSYFPFAAVLTPSFWSVWFLNQTGACS